MPEADTIDYVLEGPKWGSTGLGTAGGIVTWAVDATIPASFLSDLSAAFADWAHYANIQFQEVASTASSEIDFTSERLTDSQNNVLGETIYRGIRGSCVSAAIEFDSGEDGIVSGSQIISNGAVNLFEVALHEIGHAIGMDHYNAAPAIRNAYLRSERRRPDHVRTSTALKRSMATHRHRTCSAPIIHDVLSPGGGDLCPL